MHNWGLDSVWLGHKRLNKSVKQKFVDVQGSTAWWVTGWNEVFRGLLQLLVWASLVEKSHFTELYSWIITLSSLPCGIVEPHILWLTFTEKSGSDGQGHMLLLKVYLAPDPTEEEALTWIIFWQKPINIVCNHWHSLFACRRVRHFSPWHVL